MGSARIPCWICVGSVVDWVSVFDIFAVKNATIAKWDVEECFEVWWLSCTIWGSLRNRPAISDAMQYDATETQMELFLERLYTTERLPFLGFVSERELRLEDVIKREMTCLAKSKEQLPSADLHWPLPGRGHSVSSSIAGSRHMAVAMSIAK